jgi:hypothetical protein
MKSYTTSDLPVAAYLMMKGLSLVRADRLSGRFIFELDDPDGRGTKLAIEYLNSDFCKFDNYIRNLKSVLYQNKKP